MAFVSAAVVTQEVVEEQGGICSICLENIALKETALIHGCEHAYCVTCILRWATYSQKPSCPQCKHSFESLFVHRSLDGCIHDYLQVESVCLLLRAPWFVPLVVQPGKDVVSDEYTNIYEYDIEDDDDDFGEDYFPTRSSNLRIGNRRWGDNGYVQGGRKEARPVRQMVKNDAGPSRQPKEPPKDKTGRRAKRAMKREAADKAAIAKHEQHLERLGRK